LQNAKALPALPSNALFPADALSTQACVHALWYVRSEEGQGNIRTDCAFLLKTIRAHLC
jgi:hypothetical protein